MMGEFLVPPAASVAFSLLIGLLVREMGLRRGYLSDPRRIRFYRSPRPLFGGVVVFLSFWLGMGLVGILYSNRLLEDVRYPPETVRAMLESLFWATFFLTLHTALTDRRGDTGYSEWLFVAGAAIFAALNGYQIQQLSIPFLGEVLLGDWGIPAAVVWILIVVGTVEVLESLTGTAAIVPIVLGCLVFFWTSGTGETLQPVMCLVFSGLLLGFLPCHLVPRGIVFGKAGNKIPAFLFAAVTLVARQKASTFQFLIIPLAVIVLYVTINNVVTLEKKIRTA